MINNILIIIIAIMLVIIGLSWAYFWLMGSAMTSETGTPNSLTTLALLLSGGGLLPLALAVWLLVQHRW